MSKLNLSLQAADSFEYFREAVKASYGNYYSYKYIENTQSWTVYTELVPELVLTYDIDKGSDEETLFLSEKPSLIWPARKRIDANVTDFDLTGVVEQHFDITQSILESLDGYYPYSLGEDYDRQHSNAISTIRQDLDGYALNTDIDSLGNTITENYQEHSTAIQTILQDLDGYVEKTQKGAANGVATLDSGGKIPSAQIPAVALPEVHVVLDDAERLALSVQEGDEAIQTSDGQHYIYDGSDWYVRPVNPHSVDHHQGGADQVNAQDLGSGSASSGKIMETDGSGGWNLIDTPSSGSSGNGIITFSEKFFANGGSSNYWLELGDGAYSNSTFFVVPWDCKINAITFSNSNSAPDLDIEVYKSDAGDGNSNSKIIDWDVSNKRVAYDSTLSVSLSAGDKLGIYLKDKGSNPSDPVVTLYFAVSEDAQNGSGGESFGGSF